MYHITPLHWYLVGHIYTVTLGWHIKVISLLDYDNMKPLSHILVGRKAIMIDWLHGFGNMRHYATCAVYRYKAMYIEHPNCHDRDNYIVSVSCFYKNDFYIKLLCEDSNNFSAKRFSILPLAFKSCTIIVRVYANSTESWRLPWNIWVNDYRHDRFGTKTTNHSIVLCLPETCSIGCVCFLFTLIQEYRLCIVYNQWIHVYLCNTAFWTLELLFLKRCVLLYMHNVIKVKLLDNVS